MKLFRKVGKSVAEWATVTKGVTSVSLHAVGYPSLAAVLVMAIVDGGAGSIEARFSAELSRDVQAHVRVAVFQVLSGELARARERAAEAAANHAKG